MELITPWHEMGRREGRQEGRREEATAIALRLLRRRVGSLPAKTSRRVKALGIKRLERLTFESRPGDPSLGRLVESTVWVNDAHPAYGRAVASRADGYHLALTVAMALAPLAVEAADTQLFLTSFLARWGEALESPPTGRTGRRRGTSAAKRGDVR